MLTSLMNKCLLLGRDTKSYLPMITMADLPLMIYLIATQGIYLFYGNSNLSYYGFAISTMIMLTSVLSMISTFQLQRSVCEVIQNESNVTLFARFWVFSRTGFYITAMTIYVMTMVFSFIFFMFYFCFNIYLVILTCSGVVFYRKLMDEIRLGDQMSEDMIQKNEGLKGIMGRLF